MAINADTRSKIVISASGMCEAGRIKHHLKHNLWKPENTILFVGYQAVGTLGRRLLEGANYVTLFGESVKVAAQIRQLQGMSGHADQKGLELWIQHVQQVKKVFVIHGETTAADTFTELLNEQGISAYAPYRGTEFDVASGQFLHEAEPVYLEKPKSVKASATYDRLQIALDRVTAYIQNARGYSNKELAKMADQLTQLCNKWEQ